MNWLPFVADCEEDGEAVSNPVVLSVSGKQSEREASGRSS